MANWEKLIEEHYEKKNKIDFKDFYQLIDEALARETNYQGSGAIEGHAGKRLSTKGTKKAGGDPFDEEPPKARSKSAPAGFGVLEEEGLEEATIRDSRTFYYVSPKNLTSSMWGKIKAEAAEDGVELEDDKMAFEDRIFAVQIKQDETYYYELYLLPAPVKAKYGLRGLVLQSNAKKSAVGDMSKGQKIFTYNRVNVKPGITKITWLQTKPEELRAENEHLMMIKQKFIDNGIGDDPEKGLKPATITIKPTHGNNARTFENIVRIDKMMSKTAVGDFGLYSQGDNKPVFSISHKAVGFERYAALKSTLKELKKTEEGQAAQAFLDATTKIWTDGAVTGQRSTKGYYQKVSSPDFAKEVVYFIYGTGGGKADALAIGEITLTKTGENEFELSTDSAAFGPAKKGGKGASECIIYDTLPTDWDYMPIFKTRQGSNGSWVVLGDYGATANEKQANRQAVLARLTEMVSPGPNGEKPQTTIEALENMSYVIEHEKDELTGAIVITSAKLSVRYYVSPARRTDGAEEIKFEN